MTLHLLAPAKINLGLEILGRRPDGYHEIRTLLAAVSLYDDLVVEPSDHIEVVVDRADLAGGQNLVTIAAGTLNKDFPQATARVELRKNIPAAAGLGGASSDAAATLVALNELRSLGLSATTLESYGARIGSDVPFFVNGGCALASGRGEILTPVSAPSDLFVVIIAPRIEIPAKTATLYRSLHPSDFTDGSNVEASAQAGDWLANEALLANAFERPLFHLLPSLQELRAIIRQAGARAVGLSGAGPAHYALFRDAGEASVTAGRLREALDNSAAVFTCRTIPHGVTIHSNGSLQRPAPRS